MPVERSFWTCPTDSPLLEPQFHRNTELVRVEIVTADALALGHTYWDSGSRNTYHVANVARPNSRGVHLGHDDPPQFNGPKEPREQPIGNGRWIIRRGTFHGSAATPVVYIHASDLPKFEFPAPGADTSKLTGLQKWVLAIAANYNSRGRADAMQRQGVSRADFVRTASELSDLGLARVNKRGAVKLTAAGRNVARDIKLDSQDRIPDESVRTRYAINDDDDDDDDEPREPDLNDESAAERLERSYNWQRIK